LVTQDLSTNGSMPSHAIDLDTTMPNPAILPLWSLSPCPLVSPHTTDHHYAVVDPRIAWHTSIPPHAIHMITNMVPPTPGPLLSLSLCQISFPHSAKHARHGLWTKGARQYPNSIVITALRHASARMLPALDAPVPSVAPSRLSSSPSLLAHAHSTPLQYLARQAPLAARAPSPSP
jgi:hypothetical protein